MTSYRRFVILSSPRTGSHMLAQALNSSPVIVCFREVFNAALEYVDFSVDGYDNFSAADRALRERDPVGFLQTRIFGPQPDGIQAVGFKFLHNHGWKLSSVADALVADRDLHVLHLRRRNLLRMYVSLKFAEATDVWLQDPASRLARARLLSAVRHPIQAARRLQRMLFRPRQTAGATPRLRVSPDECYEFMVQSALRYQHFDRLYEGHPMLAIEYENLVEDRERAFADAQSFLGVEPQPLTVTTQQQRPEPLRELIENYDELQEALKDTPFAPFFE